MVTLYDIEEIQQHCNRAFSQQEIVSLYQRFCQFDRNIGGFISAEAFLSVPEFAVNPLSLVYDSDGNGKVTFDHMMDVLGELTGSFFRGNKESKFSLDLEETGYSKDSLIILSDFVKILGNSGMKMEVEVPVD